MEFYLVGGSVRDKLLGIKSKDNDYVVMAKSFGEMKQAIVDRGGTIFLETPQHFTIRATIPGMGACDFVLPRVDGFYGDGRRPDSVSVGTLMDDLARRDFTVNAIALDENGDYVDPHNGKQDIEDRVLRCVGKAYDRFNEDALRLLRALRFTITKGFLPHSDVENCLANPNLAEKLQYNVSDERKREELHKCFKHNTLETLKWLEMFPHVRDACFQKMWLMPTLKDQ